jgi:hypothetical protein
MGRGKYIELTKLKNSTTQPKKKKKWGKDFVYFTKEDILVPISHMKRFSALVIREMQIKTTVRHHFTLTIWQQSKRQTITSVNKDLKL